MRQVFSALLALIVAVRAAPARLEARGKMSMFLVHSLADTMCRCLR